MTRSLDHRGPDGSGVWRARFREAGQDFEVALGHTRLSIIDLSERGRQPMESADGSIVLSYNGEVYNFQALRAELERLGHQFRSSTDTEVILQAYRAWGLDALTRLNGMFAFAIWDGAAQRLLLARDRTGIKPLYYRWADGVLSFASELRALRAHSGFRARLERRALTTYLRLGWLTGPQTLYRDTFRLLPGHALVWQAGALSTRCFWKLSDQGASEERSFEAGVDELEEILGSAVEGCLISDVPLGAFLSGGIDSSAVVALMKERARGPVRTFSIGFAEREFDEAPYAREVARHLGTDHTELYVDRRAALRILDELPAVYDEPLADSSAIPTLLLCKLTRGHVTVALSGDGGDELFGGYDRYQKLASLLPALRAPAALRRGIGWLATRYLPASPVRNGLIRLGDANGIAELAEGFLADLEAPLARQAAGTSGSVAAERFLEVFRAAPARSAVRRAMYAEACTYMTDDVLVKVDRASMSVGLEVRVPVLDHHVVEFAFGLPDAQLSHQGRTKAPLRALLYRRVPPALLERPKQGFGFPLRALLGSELDAWVAEHLAPARIAAQGILAPAAVERIVADAKPAGPRGDERLWRLLCFQRWLAAHHPQGLDA